MRRKLGGGAIFLVCAFGLAACAQAGVVGNGDGLGGHDSGPTGDLAGLDLSGVDGGVTDGPPATLCNLFPQSGCGTGEKCTLAGPDAGTSCVADGTKQSGEICGASGADDCIAGDLCVGESMTIGQCRPFCAQDSDCKQAAQGGIASNLPHCLIPLTGSSSQVCTVACQPVTRAGASGCATGLACQVFGTMTIPQATDCAAPGAGTNGADCSKNGDGDCAAGYTCVSETPAGGGTATDHCRQVCRSGTSGDCNGTGEGGYTCQAPTGTGPFPWGFCEP